MHEFTTQLKASPCSHRNSTALCRDHRSKRLGSCAANKQASNAARQMHQSSDTRITPVCRRLIGCVECSVPWQTAAQHQLWCLAGCDRRSTARCRPDAGQRCRPARKERRVPSSRRQATAKDSRWVQLMARCFPFLGRQPRGAAFAQTNQCRWRRWGSVRAPGTERCRRQGCERPIATRAGPQRFRMLHGCVRPGRRGVAARSGSKLRGAGLLAAVMCAASPPIVASIGRLALLFSTHDVRFLSRNGEWVRPLQSPGLNIHNMQALAYNAQAVRLPCQPLSHSSGRRLRCLSVRVQAGNASDDTHTPAMPWRGALLGAFAATSLVSVASVRTPTTALCPNCMHFAIGHSEMSACRLVASCLLPPDVCNRPSLLPLAAGSELVARTCGCPGHH